MNPGASAKSQHTSTTECGCSHHRDTLIAFAAPAIIVGLFAILARALNPPKPAAAAEPSPRNPE